MLILGSMPGIASLQQQQYYAHPRNAFWPIMQALFGIEREQNYQLRLAALNNAGIGLWDVLATCHRQGSLDSAICQKTAEPNDFAALFERFAGIGHVFFNGKMAHQLFRRHVIPDLAVEQLDLTILPSTSPANAMLGFRQKLASWRVIKTVLDDAKR